MKRLAPCGHLWGGVVEKVLEEEGHLCLKCDHLAAAASVGAIELVSDRPTQPVGEAPEVCVARVGLYVR